MPGAATQFVSVQLCLHLYEVRLLSEMAFFMLNVMLLLERED